MQVTDLFAGSLTAAATSGAAASDASNTIDREDFLALLVAQLQNQDPLNPLESAEFSSQLAQFSSLEQLMQINDGIESLSGTSNGGQVDALALLGRDVRAASDQVEVVGGEHSDLSFDLSTSGTVDVEISSGDVSFGTFSLGDRGAGTHSLVLSDLDGVPPLPDGTYNVTVRSLGTSGTPEPVPTWVLGQVTGVDLNDGDPRLLLGSRRISVADVREVRNAPSADVDPDPNEDL